tara:strand:- start:1777 stop:2622 length:846 start_codon:yes stop_codon:yes gene_type:complete
VEKVSIILTVYNNSNYLKKCIQTIINQSYPPREIILIDDGSKDQQTKKNYLAFKDNKKIHFRYYKIKNRGPSGSRNFGLTKIKYSYFCFFDPDDLMTHNFIKDKIKKFRKLKDLNIFGVYSNAKLKNKKYLTIFKYKNGLCDSKNINSIGYYHGVCGSLPCYLFRKHILIKSLKFDEKIKINEDFDFIIRALKNNLKVYGVNKINTIVNLQEESLTRSKKNQYLVYKNQIKFLKKAYVKKFFTKIELKKRKRYVESKMFRDFLKKYDLVNFLKHFYKYLII